MFGLRSRKKPNPAREVAHLNLKIRKSSARRSFLKNWSLRPPGPYRPARLPRPSKNRGYGGFLTALFILGLVATLAYTWKASLMAETLTRLDAARSHQQELQERLTTLQLIMQESSNYSRIEPLAREKLGMMPTPQPPVVIAPLDERVAAMPAQDNKVYLASRKDQGR